MTALEAVGVRALAVAMLDSAVEVLRSDPPPHEEPPPGPQRSWWRHRWREWIRGRVRDVSWFQDPKHSSVWCDAAGLEYSVVIEQLEARGLLELPRPEDVPAVFRAP